MRFLKSTYQWLVDRDAFSGIVSSVLFPLILVPLLVWSARELKTASEQDQETVCMNIPAALADYTFKLRYVREGVGGWTPGKPLYEKNLDLVNVGAVNRDSTRTKCQTINFAQRYGVQFKPFVSLKGKPLSFEAVSDLLQKAGFTDVTKDSILQEPNVWFLLPQYNKIEDQGSAPGVGRIYNNFIVR